LRNLLAAVVTLALIIGQPLLAHDKEPELRGAAISGRLSVPVYSPIIIEAEIEVPDGWDALYDWDAERPLGIREFNNGKTACVWGPPGEYEVELEVFLAHYDEEAKRVKFDKKTLVTLLTITGDAPEPVKPAPVGEKRVVVVHETANGVPLQVEVARKSLEINNIQLILTDDDAATGGGSTPKFLQSSIEAAKAVGIPAMVVTVGGEVVKSLPLPDTGAEIVEVAR